MANHRSAFQTQVASGPPQRRRHPVGRYSHQPGQYGYHIKDCPVLCGERLRDVLHNSDVLMPTPTHSYGLNHRA